MDPSRPTRPTVESICRHDLWFIRWVLLHHKVPPADVDDVIQGLLLSVHRSLPTYDPARSHLHTWLFTIARRAAVTHRRRLQAQAMVGAALSAGAVSIFSPDGAATIEALEDPAPDGEEKMIEEEERKLLYEILGRMPPKRRETFELHAFGGMSDSEVAAVLDVPKNTVKSRIAQARLEIEASLAKLRERSDRRAAGLLPISATALIARERARLAGVPDAVQDQLGRRLPRARLTETRAPEQGPRSVLRRSHGGRALRAVSRRLPFRVALSLSLSGAVCGGMLAAAVMWATSRTATPPTPSHWGEAAGAVPGTPEISASSPEPSLPEEVPSRPQLLELAPPATRPTLMLDTHEKEAVRKPRSEPPARRLAEEPSPLDAGLDPAPAIEPRGGHHGPFILRDSVRSSLHR